jgi:hypothetical protein
MSYRSLRINSTDILDDLAAYRVDRADSSAYLVHFDAVQVAFLPSVVPDQVHQTAWVADARQGSRR